jgi:hypothetical protein
MLTAQPTAIKYMTLSANSSRRQGHRQRRS